MINIALESWNCSMVNNLDVYFYLFKTPSLNLKPKQDNRKMSTRTQFKAVHVEETIKAEL